MSEVTIRHPHIDEAPVLQEIWYSIFGDIGIDAFFNTFYDPGFCVVTEFKGSITSMGYLLSSGDIKVVQDSNNSEMSLRSAMIYSVGTLPAYRGEGFGSKVVDGLINLAHESDYDAVVLCPSEDSLFEYYSTRTKLRDWFFINEYTFIVPPTGVSPVVPEKISVNDYISMREELLGEIVHIRQESQHFKYQHDLSVELGGGLFRIGDSCAVVERQPNGAVWIKELLIPDICDEGQITDFEFNRSVVSIAQTFPSHVYLVRTPAGTGRGRRFGMIDFLKSGFGDFKKSNVAPWYGMAFD